MNAHAPLAQPGADDIQAVVQCLKEIQRLAQFLPLFEAHPLQKYSFQIAGKILYAYMHSDPRFKSTSYGAAQMAAKSALHWLQRNAQKEDQFDFNRKKMILDLESLTQSLGNVLQTLSWSQLRNN